MRTNPKKYQFFITYRDSILASAASKPVIDTRNTLTSLGYEDCSLSFKRHTKSLSYYLSVLFKFSRFLFKIKKGSLVATQYPLPTVGYFFIYIIKLAALRGIYFISIIHDIDTLRTKESDKAQMKKELKMLSAYNGLVVHNDVMKSWLFENGLEKTTKAVSLNCFDYLSSNKVFDEKPNSNSLNEIAFAGHLAKSGFIYELTYIKNWKFNIYGTGFEKERNRTPYVIWQGEFSPDEIVYHLKGSFGLVWDGADSSNIETNTFGNYMRYNNPFKFSLYLAAGLPVIAPATAAIAKTIQEKNIGFLINDLEDLNNVNVSESSYQVMKENVKVLQKDIVVGNYLRKAVQRLEQSIQADT
ncbi:MAG TPA: hypothetical protein VF622_07405 [Segetibacter sp.]|jgi:hypothetical protein